MEYCMRNDSECSSGCESGWTVYLDDNSFVSGFDNGYTKKGILGRGKCGFEDAQRTEEEKEEEEDMSMVSDASSGPPHFPEEEAYFANDDTNKCFYHDEPVDAAARLGTKNRAKKQGSREKKRRDLHEKSSVLDDTASSPVFDLSNQKFNLPYNHGSAENLLMNNVSNSKGYSTTQFEGSSAYHQSQYGFFQYSSLSGNYLQQNQWFGGRAWQ